MSSFTTEEKKYGPEDIKIENVQEVQDLYEPVDPPNTRWNQIKHKVTTRDGWIGNYDYRALWYITKNDFIPRLALSNSLTYTL